MAAVLPVVQAAWVLQADQRSLLAGDVAPVVGWLVLLALPGVVGAVAAWRWPRLAGVVLAGWLVPWKLWFLDEHLEPEALWPLVGLFAVALAVAGARWSTAWVWPAGAVLGALAAMWPVAGRPTPSSQAPAACSLSDGELDEAVDTIVLVTLDTFRADHLGAIGGARFEPPTPHLDRLVERGTLFTEGVAPAPLTGPAHTAMLTGCDPLGIGVIRNGVAVPEAVPRVAEVLRERGYRTGAFVAASVLDRKTGLGEGFDHYDDRFDVWHRLRGTWPRPLFGRLGWMPARRHRPGGEVVERALRWLGSEEGSTFLWVHLYDAHHPYDPDPAFVASVVDADPDGQGAEADVRAWKRWAKQYHRVPDLPGVGLGGDLSERLRAYAAEVSEVDALAGSLIDALPAGAAVLVAADHGESLTEHGYLLNHGAHAYQATLRVPFVAVGPGFAAGERVNAPTPETRVAGTLLRWGGRVADGLDTPYEGSIESYAAGQEARRRLRLARGGAELSLREGSTKWLVRSEQAWRFDLNVDPEEREPVPVAAEELQERLHVIGEGGSPLVMGLEALGYVE